MNTDVCMQIANGTNDTFSKAKCSPHCQEEGEHWVALAWDVFPWCPISADIVARVGPRAARQRSHSRPPAASRGRSFVRKSLSCIGGFEIQGLRRPH